MSEKRSDPEMTFWEHLHELRSRLFRSVLAMVAGTAIAWHWQRELLDWLLAPFDQAWRVHFGTAPQIHYPDPAGMFLAFLKLSLAAGAVLALPLLFYQLWAFIAPGLYAKEKRWTLPFVGASTGLFTLGSYFAMQVVLPITFTYLLSFVAEAKPEPPAKPDVTEPAPPPSEPVAKPELPQNARNTSEPRQLLADARLALERAELAVHLAYGALERTQATLDGREPPLRSDVYSQLVDPYSQPVDPPDEPRAPASPPDEPRAETNPAKTEPKLDQQPEARRSETTVGGVRIVPTIMVGEYIRFITRMLLAFGLVFELPVVAFFLSVIGLVNHLHLIRFFRYFVVIAFLLGAVITPPDALSQFLLAVPLVLLYGVSIGIAYVFGKRQTMLPVPGK